MAFGARLSQSLGRRNRRRCLVGVPALLVAAVDCSRHVVVGLAGRHSAIRIGRRRNQRGVDLGVRAPGSGAAIDIVSSDIGGSARGPA